MNTAQKYHALGQIAWLWTSSPLQTQWPIHLLGQFCLPPIEHKQYCLLTRADHPVAYCSWAYLNAQAEARYLLNPSELYPSDWRCGDRLWFIDWIAPFSAQDSRALKNQLSQQFCNQVARAIRIKNKSGIARVMQFKGNNIASDQARIMLNHSYRDFATYLGNHLEPHTS